MRNLQEQVKKAYCNQKFFWPFTAWINCSSDFQILGLKVSNFKSFSQSLEQFFLTVGQNNFGNKIPFKRVKHKYILWNFTFQSINLLFYFSGMLLKTQGCNRQRGQLKLPFLMCIVLHHNFSSTSGKIELAVLLCKGQLISKGHFYFFLIFPKNEWKISAPLTEMSFASFFSGRFITVTVVNPLERKDKLLCSRLGQKLIFSNSFFGRIEDTKNSFRD